MPKIEITDSKGLVQSVGSGFTSSSTTAIKYPKYVELADSNVSLSKETHGGAISIVPNVGGDRTYKLPAPEAGLYLRIVNQGALAKDGHDVLITTNTLNTDFFHGAVLKHDMSEGGQTTTTVYGDGDSNDHLLIELPYGFDLQFLGKSSTSWYVWGWGATEDKLQIADADSR